MTGSPSPASLDRAISRFGTSAKMPVSCASESWQISAPKKMSVARWAAAASRRVAMDQSGQLQGQPSAARCADHGLDRMLRCSSCCDLDFESRSVKNRKQLAHIAVIEIDPVLVEPGKGSSSRAKATGRPTRSCPSSCRRTSSTEGRSRHKAARRRMRRAKSIPAVILPH